MRLPNTLNVSFIGRVGADLLARFDSVAASTGSALPRWARRALSRACGHGRAIPHRDGGIRFSLGRTTTESEIDDVVGRLRELVPANEFSGVIEAPRSVAGLGPSMNRVEWLRRGIALEGVTLGYNALEGMVAIVAGLVAGSVALTGFGIDSVIEVSSGVLLWWRLRAELGAAHLGPTVERRAARGAGLLLLVLGAYIVIDSARLLLTRTRPESSAVGIAVTAVSLIVMPLLARAKLRVADQLGSGALRADAHETIVCAWLSATTLTGLGLNALLGWWWADPVAALVMLPLIVREGLEGWRSGSAAGNASQPG